MPSALYGFLFLSDCTNGSYRDGSHALRWKHSTLDHGLLLFHLTYIHTHTRTHTHTHTHADTLKINTQKATNACTRSDNWELKTCHTLSQKIWMLMHVNMHSFMRMHAVGVHMYVTHSQDGNGSPPSGPCCSESVWSCRTVSADRQALWSETHTLATESQPDRYRSQQNQMKMKLNWNELNWFGTER